ncbi:HEAT repeat domain-containing protein [Trichocoleus sp. ST-U3]
MVQLQELTTNRLTRPGVSLELDDIYVERGLQKLQPQPKLGGDFSKQPTQALFEGNEITQPTHQQFFDQVLELGQSPTSQGRLAITGEAGAGKSTLLRKIASKILENHLGFPIWIRLAHLRDRSLSEYLLTYWLDTINTNINSEQLERFLKQQCLEGRVWLLLDELDKMPQSSRILLLDSMEQGWVKGAQIIITSRTEVWQFVQNELPNFSVYRPVNFSASQLRQFISNWFKQVGSSEQGLRLLHRLENPRSEHIRDLSKNPLYCSLLCYAYGMGRGELPPTKAELYSDYVDSLYEWQKWKPDHSAETKPTKRELRQALGELARRALEEGLTILKQDFIKNHFAELEEPLFKLALELNLIILLGRDPEKPSKNLYAFFHSTFQEYFAAGAIADNWHFFLNPVPGNPAAGSYRLFDSESKWLDVYLFWLGLPDVNSASKLSLFRALVGFEDECGFNSYQLLAYFIAAAGLPEFKSCPPSLADEIVGTIVKLSIGTFEAEDQPFIWLDNSIAASALTVLLWTDAKRAVDFLVSNFSLIVENKYFQKYFAEILGEIGIGHSKAIQAVSQLLLRNPDEETKRIWLWCLGEIGIGDANAVSTLAQLYCQSSDETTCLEIAESIMKVDPNNKYAIAAFLSQVASSGNHSYIASILERYGVENRIVIEFLIQKINNTTDDFIGLKFASFLSLVNPKESLFYLQKLLTSQKNEIRFEAACTLQKISPDNPQAIQTLRNLLTCENNFLVFSAATMLQDINPGSTKVQDIFIKLLNSKDDYIVLLTAREWRKIKVNTAELVNILLEIVRNSRNKADQEDAARTLLEIAKDNQNVTREIIKLLDTRRDEETQRLVTWYLGEIVPASSESIKVLIGCLSSSITQSVAIVSLGQVAERDEEAVSALINMLQSPVDEELRREAIKSLGKIGFDNLNAIRALEKLVDESEDEETCFVAACTLSETSAGKSKGIKALKNLLLSTQSFLLQFQAAMALWQRLPGDIIILEILIGWLLDNQGNPDIIKLDFDPEERCLLTTIADFLKTLVLPEQLSIIDQISIIINTIKSYKSRQDLASQALYGLFGYGIIWHYTQNLPYEKFYQACRGE